jgi:Na+:H+ antiporter, NhaA family
VGFARITKFFRWEAADAVILFVMALAALILCNSPWDTVYQKLLQTPLTFHISDYILAHPLLFWINEGLMSLFFLSIGLELKHEFMVGELRQLSQIVLPAIGALGGMLVPAFIYLLLNFHDSSKLVGWAIPVATDIAFALGVLALFGKRVPPALRIFLLALAIFDDVGAIVIIALFHSQSLSPILFLLAAAVLVILFLFNKYQVERLWVYLLVGLELWICVLNSGVHATVAGVLLGLTIPLHTDSGAAPAERLQKILRPVVAFIVMPLFAFANAGMPLYDLSATTVLDSVTLGTILGLVVGKQLGVLSFSWLLIRSGFAKLPKDTTWLAFYGIALLCGIGFTMSLFLGTLAFQDSNPVFMTEVRLGVLVGSLLSGILGALILQMALAKKAHS